MKIEFLDRYFRKAQISNFIKINPLEAELFHADRRRTDGHDEANSRLSQFFERFWKRQENDTRYLSRNVDVLLLMFSPHW